jgi:hypothetical protein
MSDGPYRVFADGHGNRWIVRRDPGDDVVLHLDEAAAELNRLHKVNSRLVAALTKDAERYGELEIGHYWVIRDYPKDWLVGRAMTLGDDRTVEFGARYSTALEAVTELVRRVQQEATDE